MLHLKIISPERIVYDGPSSLVTVPGTMGAFQILQNHAPIISSLEEGLLSWDVAEGDRQQLQVKGGFVEVLHNVVSVCVEV